MGHGDWFGFAERRDARPDDGDAILFDEATGEWHPGAVEAGPGGSVGLDAEGHLPYGQDREDGSAPAEFEADDYVASTVITFTADDLASDDSWYGEALVRLIPWTPTESTPFQVMLLPPVIGPPDVTQVDPGRDVLFIIFEGAAPALDVDDDGNDVAQSDTSNSGADGWGFEQVVSNSSALDLVSGQPYTLAVIEYSTTPDPPTPGGTVDLRPFLLSVQAYGGIDPVAWGRHIEGVLTRIQDTANGRSAESAHAEGHGSYVEGWASHAEGIATRALGRGSHAEGEGSAAYSAGTHAEGRSTRAVQQASHAEGFGTLAQGDSAHAEGYLTKAEGGNSHTEGANTHAAGPASHAEGQGTVAGGLASHAEGLSTSVSGAAGHAEGESTVVDGVRAHAQGYRTHAVTESSHAEGVGSMTNNSADAADGIAAHAMGHYAEARHHDQLAHGAGYFDEVAPGIPQVGQAQYTRNVGKLVLEEISGAPDGGIIVEVPLNTFSGAVRFQADVVAIRTDGGTETAGFSRRGLASVMSGGAIVGAIIEEDWKDPDASTWDVTVTVESSRLRVRCLGETDKTTRWVCTVHLTEVHAG